MQRGCRGRPRLRWLAALGLAIIAGKIGAIDPVPRLPAVSIRQTGPSDSADSFRVRPCTVTKAEVAQRLRLPLRDLRLIEAHGNLAAISARRGAVILSLVSVRAVVLPGETLVLASSEAELERLVTRVMAHLTLTAPDSDVGSFENRCLEACVQHAVCAVRNHLAGIKEEIYAILACLRTVPSQKGLSLHLQALLPLKNELDKLSALALELVRAINEALKNDDDLEAMQLTQLNARGIEYDRRRRASRISRLRATSRKLLKSGGGEGGVGAMVRRQWTGRPRRRSGSEGVVGPLVEDEDDDDIDHSGTEMLLEAYLTQLESLTTEAGDVAATIKNTEEAVDLQLDLLRNRILRFELRLSIAGLVLGVGCFVTGMFGMNLTSHIEEQRFMFWIVSFMLCFGMGGGFAAFVEFSRRRGLLS